MTLAAALVFSHIILGPTDRPLVSFQVEKRGTFVIELRPDQAPKLVEHFLGLVDKGFYDRILFHRRVDGFVIQAGDPKSRKTATAWAVKNPGESGGTKTLGEGGSGQTVPYEINDLTHVKHSVGMALAGAMSDTGDSQFFINLKDNFRLNGMYCVFGMVVEGNSVISKIQRGDRILKASREKAPKPQKTDW